MGEGGPFKLLILYSQYLPLNYIVYRIPSLK
jgi:hypothetical protein